MPEILKTIIVTLKKDDKYFSFLLRANKDKTGYTAKIGALPESGKYELTIMIFDYKNQILKTINGQIYWTAAIAKPAAEVWEKTKNSPYLYIWLLAILVIIAIIFIIKWIKTKNKERSSKSVLQAPSASEEGTTALPAPPKLLDAEGKERKDFPNFRL